MTTKEKAKRAFSNGNLKISVAILAPFFMLLLYILGVSDKRIEANAMALIECNKYISMNDKMDASEHSTLSTQNTDTQRRLQRIEDKVDILIEK